MSRPKERKGRGKEHGKPKISTYREKFDRHQRELKSQVAHELKPVRESHPPVTSVAQNELENIYNVDQDHDWPRVDEQTQNEQGYFVVVNSARERPVILTLQAKFPGGYFVEIPRFRASNAGRRTVRSTCEFVLPRILLNYAVDGHIAVETSCIAGGRYPYLKRGFGWHLWGLACSDFEPQDFFHPIGENCKIVWADLNSDLLEGMRPSNLLPLIYATGALKRYYHGNDRFFDGMREAAIRLHVAYRTQRMRSG